MAAGECRFDLGLRRKQQIERQIKLVLVNRAKIEHCAQRMRRRRRAELAGSGELGGGRDDTGDDHRQGELGQAGGSVRQQAVEAELARHAEHRGDMPVRQGALDLEALRRGGRRLILEHPAQGLDFGFGPARQIGQSAGLDLAPDPVALTQ